MYAARNFRQRPKNPESPSKSFESSCMDLSKRSLNGPNKITLFVLSLSNNFRPGFWCSKNPSIFLMSSFCVFVLCLRFVFSFCVFVLCFCFVFSFCVFVLCFRFVFLLSVFVLKTPYGAVSDWIAKFGLLEQCDLPLILGTDIIDKKFFNL